MSRNRPIGLALAALLVLAGLPLAAQPADPHAGHHPGGPALDAASPTPPASPPPASPLSAAPSADCGAGAMGCMGRPPVKQLYPQLMALPAMTPEARAKIEADARARIDAGNAALAAVQSDYHRAMIDNDATAMAAAMARQRVALGEMESGTAALAALAAGQPPRQIALAWFRDQMNLSPGVSLADSPIGPFGVSWFHFVSMVAAGLFALTMLAFGIGRHRRSVALVNQLTRAAPVAKPVEAPPPPPRLPSTVAAPGRGWTGSLQVAAIVRETPHVKTFRLVEPNGGPIPFTFVPGQFLTFSAEIDGRTIRRAYTIASPPSRNSYVEITVKREDEGEFSRFLHDKLVVGGSLQVNGPSGVFTFDGGTADNIVLIAGGVGITPMMCVIRYLTDTSWPGEIFLVFAMRSTEEFVFREELEYLQRRHPRLHVAATIGERSEGTAWMGLEGPIGKETLARAVPGIEKRRIHLCGPPPMMEVIRRLLGELGVPQDQVKTEAFGPATGLVPPARPAPAPPPPASVAALLEKVDIATSEVSPQQAIGPATATVSFARSARSAPMPPDKSVLEVAESIGVPIDYSCRVGTCGICKTRLLAGQVSMEVQDALTDQDKAEGMILACQAHALHDIAVDA